MQFEPIGIIHSPFTEPAGMPIQAARAVGVRGQVEVFGEVADGLADLEGFSHIILLYHFHRAGPCRLMVTPFLDSKPRGVFATRAPTRPNPIGLSVVRLLAVEGLVLHCGIVATREGTPVLDIKPYVPDFDQHPADRIGWLAQAQQAGQDRQADDRFV